MKAARGAPRQLEDEAWGMIYTQIHNDLAMWTHTHTYTHTHTCRLRRVWMRSTACCTALGRAIVSAFPGLLQVGCVRAPGISRLCLFPCILLFMGVSVDGWVGARVPTIVCSACPCVLLFSCKQGWYRYYCCFNVHEKHPTLVPGIVKLLCHRKKHLGSRMVAQHVLRHTRTLYKSCWTNVYNTFSSCPNEVLSRIQMNKVNQVNRSFGSLLHLPKLSTQQDPH